jgi:hypothetical protein
MKSARVRRNREQWQELVQQWEASGKYATDWCREHKIAYDRFLSWKKRFKGTTSQSRSSFVELADSPSAESGIEIHHRGFSLILCKDFDSEALLRCLQTLEKI